MFIESDQKVDQLVLTWMYVTFLYSQESYSSITSNDISWTDIKKSTPYRSLYVRGMKTPLFHGHFNKHHWKGSSERLKQHTSSNGTLIPKAGVKLNAICPFDYYSCFTGICITESITLLQATIKVRTSLEFHNLHESFKCEPT